jgi:hypothetical protein
MCVQKGALPRCRRTPFTIEETCETRLRTDFGRTPRQESVTPLWQDIAERADVVAVKYRRMAGQPCMGKDHPVQDLPMVLRRVARLCTSLAKNESLRHELQQAGFPAEEWESLADAIHDTADSQRLTPLLDAIEDAAAKTGLDGLTSPVRQFEPLPAPSSGYRTVSGWRCPHPRRCGRVDLDAKVAPVCALTQDPLTQVTVTSG